jgi:predicted alpha/beta-fold hydrolase
MVYFWIGLGAAVLISAVLVTCYICYRMAFYSPKRSVTQTDEVTFPVGKIYEPYYDQMRTWTLQTRQIPAREYSIVSFDGLRLYGKYYEFAPNAPIEIMMPGYRGLAERDLCGGVQRAFRLGHSVLLVEQRGCGKSEGTTISFGVNERRDCLQWAQLLIREFGEDVKIILTGISMGAATVTMACALGLPKNVVGIIADCGYSSAKEIIQVVIRQMGLPPKLAYPFVRLAARIYGGFDLEATPPVEAIKKCTVPIFIVH